ncbi:MAG: glycoside hydrolase family 9 protein [Myxococcota bacterium]
MQARNSLGRWRFVFASGSVLMAGCAPRSEAAPATAAAVSAPASAPAKPKLDDPRNRLAAPAMPGKNVPAIKVDTVGYPTRWQKIAILNQEPREVTLLDANGKVVHRVPAAKISSLGIDAASKDPVFRVDFSEFQQPGRYTLANGDAKSDPFEIGNGIYRRALMAAQKMFYFQRTRTKLEKPYAVWEEDAFTRAGVSHAHDQVGFLFEDFPEKKRRIQLDAGWHDAGNYDMYVPSTAPTAHGLLRAYERHPELFADKDTNIPESGNGVPDLLDEAKWGIRWVLSMQAEDGGFRVREANEDIGEPGSVPPDQDHTVRWVDRVGSASTGKGCALSAITARVYRKFDPAFATRAEASAKRAWEWLKKHPKRVMVPPVGRAAIRQPYQLWDDGTAVKTDVGARFVAAAEMWTTFQLPDALESMRALMNDPNTGPYQYPYGAWTNLTRWAMMTLAFDARAPQDLKDEAKKRLLTAAMSIKGQAETDGYLCATKPSDYYWGSNSNLLEKAELLITAAALEPREFAWAAQAARNQWHWILGRNPNGFSMVTRIGKGPEALYHMEWGPKYPHVPPGFLIDGPNYHDVPFLAPGAPAKAMLWESPKALSSGVPSGGLWHWAESDLWEGGFIPAQDWSIGWWYVTEPDIFFNMNLVNVAAEMQG